MTAADERPLSESGTSKRRWRVVGLGCVAIDQAFLMERFPGPDEKVRFDSSHRRVGGTTATALMAAAQVVEGVAYAGVWGQGDEFDAVGKTFDELNIDRTHVISILNARPIQSVTLASHHQGERSDRRVLYSLDGVTPLVDKGPKEEVIAHSEVLLVDHFGMQGMIEACHVARRHGCQIVADFESDARPEFSELLELPNHLILSEPFAEKITGRQSPSEAANQLARGGSRTVVITLGGAGCVYQEAGCEEPEAFQMGPPIEGDTTGCGDVFHGVYAATLALRMPLGERLRYASAAARLWIGRESFHAPPPSRAKIASEIAALRG
jgi:sulfofructose kinase